MRLPTHAHTIRYFVKLLLHVHATFVLPLPPGATACAVRPHTSGPELPAQETVLGGGTHGAEEAVVALGRPVLVELFDALSWWGLHSWAAVLGHSLLSLSSLVRLLSLLSVPAAVLGRHLLSRVRPPFLL